MKTVLFIVIILHGLIHLMGFAKSFGLANTSEMTLPISRGWGLLWLIAALMLLLSGMLLLLSVSFWWIPAITGVILSQILVFAFWQDARFGSVPNIIILIFIVLGFVRYTPPVSMMKEEITPAFPNLESFKGEAAEGRFEISGDPSTGFIRGEYRVVRSGDHLLLEMIPSGGWIPNESKLSVRLIYRAEPMFKQWPTTYRWSAELEQDEDSGFRMTSNWERINTD